MQQISNQAGYGIFIIYRFRTDKQSLLYIKQATIQTFKQDAVLSQGGVPRDSAVNFDMYRILQRYRTVSLPQYGFLVGLCLHTAVNLSKSERKNQSDRIFNSDK